jgi:hypothetical protein
MYREIWQLVFLSKGRRPHRMFGLQLDSFLTLESIIIIIIILKKRKEKKACY